jgi:hypothetical protein
VGTQVGADDHAAIVAWADQQHAWVITGDERGVYGVYPPASYYVSSSKASTKFERWAPSHPDNRPCGWCGLQVSEIRCLRSQRIPVVDPRDDCLTCLACTPPLFQDVHDVPLVLCVLEVRYEGVRVDTLRARVERRALDHRRI